MDGSKLVFRNLKYKIPNIKTYVPPTIQSLVSKGVIEPGYFAKKKRNLYETLFVYPDFGRGLKLFPQWRIDANLPPCSDYYIIKKYLCHWVNNLYFVHFLSCSMAKKEGLSQLNFDMVRYVDCI